LLGLAPNFSIGQGVSLPPLALAFLVDYTADISFSFLEGSMPNLGKAKGQSINKLVNRCSIFPPPDIKQANYAANTTLIDLHWKCFGHILFPLVANATHLFMDEP
jgi:hypothetical protein